MTCAQRFCIIFIINIFLTGRVSSENLRNFITIIEHRVLTCHGGKCYVEPQPVKPNTCQLAGKVPNISKLKSFDCRLNKFQPSDFDDSEVVRVHEFKINPQQSATIMPDISLGIITIDNLRDSKFQKYQWWRNEELVPDATNSVYHATVEDDGSFFYVVLNSIKAPGLSVYSDTVQYSLLNISKNVSQDLSLYPNPVAEVLFINGEEITFKQIVIIDELGRKIYDFEPNSNHAKVDIRNLDNGYYILRMEDTNGVMHTRKVLKK